MSRSKVHLVVVSAKGARKEGWSLIKMGQTRSRFLQGRAEERAADPGTREDGGGFPKEVALRMGLLQSPLLEGSLLSFLSLCPTFPVCTRPRTSSQSAALITSFHFNSAELGACELKRKFTQNTQQIECTGISETHLTLSAPSCSLLLALPLPASD